MRTLDKNRTYTSAVYANEFWAKVDKRGPRMPHMRTRCWVWTGYQLPNGYGSHGRHSYAHRTAWEISRKRKIPKGKQIRHKCDNPPCCRPSHIHSGTSAQNHADMVIRSRSNKGERHWNCKLTPAQVSEIKTDPRPSTHLADEYGVAARQIRRIRQGVRW